MSQYRPASQPDERQEAILFSQALNLAQATVGSRKDDDSVEDYKKQIVYWQEYYFDLLLEPYAPLKKAQKEREEILNKKVRTKELHTDPDTDFGEGQE